MTTTITAFIARAWELDDADKPSGQVRHPTS